MIECDRARKKRTDFKNLCAFVIVSEEPIKEREPVSRFPLKRFWFLRNLLVEVTLQHALQSLAVTGLVAGHFVDGLLFAGLSGRS